MGSTILFLITIYFFGFLIHLKIADLYYYEFIISKKPLKKWASLYHPDQLAESNFDYDLLRQTVSKHINSNYISAGQYILKAALLWPLSLLDLLLCSVYYIPKYLFSSTRGKVSHFLKKNLNKILKILYGLQKKICSKSLSD